MFCIKISRQIIMLLALLFLAGLKASTSFAQPQTPTADIDTRLVEIVDAVRLRATASQKKDLRGPSSLESEHAGKRIQAAQDIHAAALSKDIEKIYSLIEVFKTAEFDKSEPQMARILKLYRGHAALLRNNASKEKLIRDIIKFEDGGSWIERYFATQLARQLYADADERQAALQKAQQAFKLIPPNGETNPYVHFAKADTASTLAQLHNLQGNVDFAIESSLEYLRLTKDDRNANSAIDILNNLIFSHTVSRDHQALLYLSEQLVEIEKISTSTIPGLSEFRVAQAATMAGDFHKGLMYSDMALSKTRHPQLQRQITVNKAVAQAGLGQKEDARKTASNASLNLESDFLLNREKRRGVLYLGFLLAQGQDDNLARLLYNRQLDMLSKKFLANSSRDTSAMIAELENSQERQAEREAASAREAELQAMTIDRQRKLNRALIVLSVLLGGAAFASFVFMKYREKVLRKLEIKTIEAASAEKLKTEFLGMISHELRTPLNGIIGISDFLANYHEDPDIREKTSIVLRSGNELLSVIESLTDMARLDAGQLALAPHDTDLSESLPTVPENWTDRAKEKGLLFTHFIDPSITQHHVDEDRLVQCLNILLANAIRFTDTGRVHLHITGHDEGLGHVTGLTAIVADTGQGMSELVQSRLFTPFMQADTSRKRSHMGTGLSLAIAYALAEMMGGRLSVISREGRGSEFKLDIPLPAATSEITQADASSVENIELDDLEDSLLEDSLHIEKNESSSEVYVSEIPILDRADAPQLDVIDLMQPNGNLPSLHDVKELVLPMPSEGQLQILVVDDMASNRDILRLILETQGHACREAADGYAALAALEQKAFDVIVLDIHMTPLDGVETLRRIRGSRKAYANIPVVALTADNAASTNAACMEAGADLFLTKPVQHAELLRAIGYLNQAEGARILSQ